MSWSFAPTVLMVEERRYGCLMERESSSRSLGGADARRASSLRCAGVLRIPTDRLEKDGYVTYDDFGDLRPVGQTGNRWLFAVKVCLLEHGYRVHERRLRAEWPNCGYAGNSTHFHGAGG